MKNKHFPLPAPSEASAAISQELDEMVSQYNDIPEKNDFRKKWDYFWSCHAAICAMSQEGKLILLAGDCDFPYLKTLIDQDGPEYSALIIFGADTEHLYQIGVCVRGTPLLRKFDPTNRKARRIIQGMEGRFGLFFRDPTEVQH